MSEAQFYTQVRLPEYQWKTGYRKRNCFMGSCFTENVGQRMADLNYPVDINPFGILYNPESLALSIELLLAEKAFTEADLVEHNGLWHSFSHHGKFSAADAQTALATINKRIENSSAELKQADFLFVTFGTAWVYRHNKTQQIVSNCHKIPASEFTRQRLSVEAVVDRYKHLLPKLWKINPKLKVIFTVSPIRHWKDGAMENQRSKAILLLAVEALLQAFEGHCAYFPSYEIVMDELRDYRFYAADMIHLSEVAVDYIFQKFQQALVDDESLKIAERVRKIKTAVQHKPFHTNTLVYRQFLVQSYRKITALEKEYPFLNLRLEKQYFNEHLEKLRK